MGFKAGSAKVSPFCFFISCFIFGQALATGSSKDKDIPKTCAKGEEHELNRTCLTQREKQEIEKQLNKDIGNERRKAFQILTNKRQKIDYLTRTITSSPLKRQKISQGFQQIQRTVSKIDNAIKSKQQRMESCRTDSICSRYRSEMTNLEKNLQLLKNQKSQLQGQKKEFEKNLNTANNQFREVKWELKTAKDIYNSLNKKPANIVKPAETAKDPATKVAIVKAVPTDKQTDLDRFSLIATDEDTREYGAVTVGRTNRSTPQPVARQAIARSAPIPAVTPEEKPSPFKSVWNWLTGKTTPEGKPISYAGTSTEDSTESSTESSAESSPVKNPNPFRSVWNWLTGKTTPEGKPISYAGTSTEDSTESSTESSAESSPVKNPNPFRSVWNWLTGKTTPEGKPISYAGTSTEDSTESSTESSAESSPVKNPNPFRSVWNWLTGKSTSTAGSAAGGKTGAALVGAVAATAGVVAVTVASRRDTASGNAVVGVGDSTTNEAFETGETIDIVSTDCRILIQRKAMLGKRLREYEEITDEYKKIYEKLKAKKDKKIEDIKKKLDGLLKRQKQALFDVVNIDLDTKEGEKLPIASQVVTTFQVNEKKIYDLRMEAGITNHLTDQLDVTVRNGQVDKKKLIKFIKTLIDYAIKAERKKTEEQKDREEALENAERNYKAAKKLSRTIEEVFRLYHREQNHRCKQKVYEFRKCSGFQSRWLKARGENDDSCLLSGDAKDVITWEKYAGLETCYHVACKEVKDFIRRDQCQNNLGERIQLSKGAEEAKGFNRFEIEYLCALSRQAEGQQVADTLRYTAYLTGTHLQNCAGELSKKIGAKEALAILKDSPLETHLQHLSHITDPLQKVMTDRKKYCAIKEIKWAPFYTQQALFERYKIASKTCTTVCAQYRTDIEEFIRTELTQIAQTFEEQTNKIFAEVDKAKRAYVAAVGAGYSNASQLRTNYQIILENNYRLQVSMVESAGSMVERMEGFIGDYNDGPCSDSNNDLDADIDVYDTAIYCKGKTCVKIKKHIDKNVFDFYSNGFMKTFKEIYHFKNLDKVNLKIDVREIMNSLSNAERLILDRRRLGTGK